VNNYPGWLAELIETHGCGVATPPKDAIALADALGALAASPERCRVMGEAARRLAVARFGRNELARQFREQLERTAAGGQ
jgi:glycosyltransferase involved in cell wall biosynthesis